MPRKTAAALFAFALFGAAFRPVALGQDLSAHWRTTVTMEGARPGDTLQSAEIWLSGGRMRIEERGKASEKTNVLRTGGMVFVWVEGQTAGLKMSAALAAQSGRPSQDFVERVDEIRSRGRLLREEKVDGQVCEVFEYDSALDGKGTYWLAKRLRGFPLKAVLVRSLTLPYRSQSAGSVKLEYHNTDVQVPGKVPEGKLSVPLGVQFQDAMEMMVPGRPPRR